MSFPSHEPFRDELQYLQQALDGTPQQRLTMWRDLPQPPSDGQLRLRRALLLSVPGHPAYDPDAARGELAAISAEFRDSYGVLAQTRVAEMRVLQSCHTRVYALQKQLDAVADIERELGDEGR